MKIPWEERRQAYNEDFFTTNTIIVRDGQPIIHDSSVQMALLIEILSPHCVLDLGSAAGTQVTGFRKAGIEAWGIELSRFAIEHTIPSALGYNLCVDLALEPLPFSDGYFDTVMACDFLEHQDDEHLQYVLDEIHRVCNDKLFIRQPMVRFPVADAANVIGVDARDAYLQSLNGYSHQERLAMVGSIPELVHSVPDPNCYYHPQERSRNFWVAILSDGWVEETLDEKYYLLPNPAHICSFNTLYLRKK